ncbi:MAG: hypothetical protein ACXWR1_09385 [Bdellovibrionota bacterium]
MKPALIAASFFCLFFFPAKEAKAAGPSGSHAAWERPAHCAPHLPAVSGGGTVVLPNPTRLSRGLPLHSLLGPGQEPAAGAKDFRIHTGLSPPALALSA